MEKTLLRESRSGEELVILEIIKSLPDYFRPDALPEVEANLKKGGAVTLMADEGGAVVGFLTYRQTTAELANLLWMAVRSDFQKQGIGRLLMEEFLSRMKSAGIKIIELETLASTTNFAPYEATRRFYGKFGFREVKIDKDFYAPGDDRAIMRLEPSPEKKIKGRE